MCYVESKNTTIVKNKEPNTIFQVQQQFAAFFHYPIGPEFVRGFRPIHLRTERWQMTSSLRQWKHGFVWTIHCQGVQQRFTWRQEEIN
jgi:hypothetical protein